MQSPLNNLQALSPPSSHHCEHAAEAPTAADLGPGGYHSLPVLNPLSPSTLADDIHVRQTFRSEVDEKAQKVGLLNKDMKLVLSVRAIIEAAFRYSESSFKATHTAGSYSVSPRLYIHSLFSEVAFC